ncbi:H2A superfamily domain-containing protein [Histoplasma capsulatum]|uniref:H2A superfamily domain-containing protein n=1 Tax=Ajellomyces capsulatus TaxID=5037 RepID=A0A8A1LYZ4_AJECA|nr:H2A superfamily domain-containing protein [Histoplasma capsulatum]
MHMETDTWDRSCRHPPNKPRAQPLEANRIEILQTMRAPSMPFTNSLVP